MPTIDLQSVWIVGNDYGDRGDGVHSWSFIGAFDSEDGARAACTAPTHFIFDQSLNERAAENPPIWPSVYYPRVS